MEKAIILAMESSAKSASVALGDMDSLLGENFAAGGLVHSRTLLPMLQALLDSTERTIGEVDAFAVSAGPGSFTGLRIGIGAVKGLAFGLSRPCVAVSTLEALAYALPGANGLLCAAMDARCGQVYAALFEISAAGPVRQTPDQALSIAELEGRIRETAKFCKKNIFLVGDGARLCYNSFGERVPGCILAAEHVRLQRASGVLLAARDKLRAGETVSAAELMPIYLRLPQAERERLRREAASHSIERKD